MIGWVRDYRQQDFSKNRVQANMDSPHLRSLIHFYLSRRQVLSDLIRTIRSDSEMSHFQEFYL